MTVGKGFASVIGPGRLKGIALPFGHGAGRQGCAKGPEVLLAAGLGAALPFDGAPVETLTFNAEHGLPARPHCNLALKSLDVVAAATRLILQTASQVPDHLCPVFIGGDHSIAAGTVPAMARRAAGQGRPLYVLWLDAHPDFHTLETTTSGNLHGVPLAYATGQTGFADYYPSLDHPLDPARLCVMGVRSIDEAESRLLSLSKVRCFGMEDIRTQGLSGFLQSFLDEVRRNNGLLHVSFDADWLDPSLAPAVGTAVEGGIMLDEAHVVMDVLRDSGLVSSLDLVEYNPELDEAGRTAQVLVSLMAKLFASSSTRLSLKAA